MDDLRLYYEVPINSAYTYGPYMHSIKDNYFQSPISGNLLDTSLSVELRKLKSKIPIMKEQEKKFYDAFGVKDAMDFSNKYLLNRGEMLSNQATISQKILYLLNDKEVYEALISFGSRHLSRLENVAQQLLLANPDLIDPAITNCQYVGLTTLLNLLNSSSDITINTSNNKKVNITKPIRRISSLQSSYITGMLSSFNEVAISSLKDANEIRRRINVVLSIIGRRKHEVFSSDSEYKIYKKLIRDHLEAAGGLVGQNSPYFSEKNLSLFGNFLSAEGGIFEIALTIGLQPSQEMLKEHQVTTSMFANDLVTSFKRMYKIPDSANDLRIVKIQSNGKNSVQVDGESFAVYRYKSPTDLQIFIDGKSYNIQLKNTMSTIDENSQLKLQNSINLPNFLGQVSEMIPMGNVYDLLIYHIVNQSNFRGGKGLDFIYNALSLCVEYYVESAYINRLDENLNQENDQPTGANAGNLFMIYTGYLIPMSAFVEYVVKTLEPNESIVVHNDLIEYRVKHDPAEIISLSNNTNDPFQKRIELGKEVFEKARITQIKIAIGKVINMMKEFPKN